MTAQRSPSEEASREMGLQQGEADPHGQRGAERSGGVLGAEGGSQLTAPHSPRIPAQRSPVPPPPRSPTTRCAEREDVAVRAARAKVASRIEEVVRSYGVALSPVSGGRRLVGLCPFHSEEHASFTVYPETQSFCCYGCHAAGDVITFVCRLKGVGFDEALRLLGEVQASASWVGDSRESRDRNTSSPSPLAVLPLPRPGSDGRWAMEEPSREHSDDQAPELPVAVRRGATQAQTPGYTPALRLTLLSVTTAIAMQELARAPLALTYLGERGISYTLARRCRLGYLEETALAEYLAGDTELEQAAREIGLLNRLGNSTLTRRLIVPEIRRSRATQLIGRVVPGARTPMPGVKYYLVCGLRAKGLLGYGAALECLMHLTRQSGQRERQQESHDLLGILVLEGALDYVVAVGWDLPVLPVALLSAYPSRAQVHELLDLHARSGGLPFLLLLDADGPGREGTAHVTRALRERQVPFHSLPPLSRPPLPSVTYKDLGELGPVGPEGRTQLLAAIERALTHAGHEGTSGEGGGLP